MPKPPLKNIDPKKLFMHAQGFHIAEETLSTITIDRNPHLAAEIGSAVVVLSALNSELFLKCIICIETGLVPQGHYLDELFKEVSAQTQAKIEHIWTTEVVPLREPMWRKIEASIGSGETMRRDLLGALAGGSKAFQKIRYGYEGDTADVQFYISDLPRLLGRVILQMKPEWAGLRRRVHEIPNPPAGP